MSVAQSGRTAEEAPPATDISSTQEVPVTGTVSGAPLETDVRAGKQQKTPVNLKLPQAL